MQTYLRTPNEQIFALSALPLSRSEAVALITPHISPDGKKGVYRIFAVDEVNVSPHESFGLEVFAIGLRRYARGIWGLAEASAEAGEVSSDFAPNVMDIALWLKALRSCWQVQQSDFSSTFEVVEDFCLLQYFEGEHLLTSVTWNAPDILTPYRLPKTLETAKHQWGDGFLENKSLLHEALRHLRLHS